MFKYIFYIILIFVVLKMYKNKLNSNENIIIASLVMLIGFIAINLLISQTEKFAPINELNIPDTDIPEDFAPLFNPTTGLIMPDIDIPDTTNIDPDADIVILENFAPLFNPTTGLIMPDIDIPDTTNIDPDADIVILENFFACSSPFIKAQEYIINPAGNVNHLMVAATPTLYNPTILVPSTKKTPAHKMVYFGYTQAFIDSLSTETIVLMVDLYKVYYLTSKSLLGYCFNSGMTVTPGNLTAIQNSIFKIPRFFNHVVQNIKVDQAQSLNVTGVGLSDTQILNVTVYIMTRKNILSIPLLYNELNEFLHFLSPYQIITLKNSIRNSYPALIAVLEQFLKLYFPGI